MMFCHVRWNGLLELRVRAQPAHAHSPSRHDVLVCSSATPCSLHLLQVNLYRFSMYAIVNLKMWSCMELQKKLYRETPQVHMRF